MTHTQTLIAILGAFVVVIAFVCPVVSAVREIFRARRRRRLAADPLSLIAEFRRSL